MKANTYFEFKNGNKFKIQEIKNGLCHCRVVGRYEVFYMTVSDVEQKSFDDEIKEIAPPQE